MALACATTNNNERGSKMTMRQFIKENRTELDKFIQEVSGNDECRFNNEERLLWILNDEGLYRWARSEGVKI
jgi:hypothetical protein